MEGQIMGPCTACGHLLIKTIHIPIPEGDTIPRVNGHQPGKPFVPMTVEYHCRNCGSDRTMEWERIYECA